MDVDVQLGCSLKDPGSHCFDGDSVYVTGSAVNVLVRLAGIDACEVRGLSLYYLRKSGFLNRLNHQLREWLEPRLTQESIRVNKLLGFEAKDYLESILEKNLVLSLGIQPFDRYGRMLVYLSGQNQGSYNFKMVETGYAIPYFIYPNAVSPTEKGEFNYDTMVKMSDAAIKAHESDLGLWAHNNVLIPMELRYLTRREFPVKYCADLVNDVIHPPYHYFKVPIEDRLFFTRKMLLLQLCMGSDPCQPVMTGCRSSGEYYRVHRYVKREKRIPRK
jgi:endonuclease YncB( thermonuclease family)